MCKRTHEINAKHRKYEHEQNDNINAKHREHAKELKNEVYNNMRMNKCKM